MGGTLRMSNFKILSNFSGFWTPRKLPTVPSDVSYAEIYLTNFKVFTFLGGICMGGILRMSNLKFLSNFNGFWTPI
jgi:hypothetical protein